MPKRLRFIIGFVLLTMVVSAQKQWLFIGTYTGNGSKGIYVYQFDPETGEAKPTSSIACENPSYLAVSPDGKFVYSVTENGGDNPGSVSSYSFDEQNGELKFLNMQLSGGDHPCYVAVDSRNEWVAVANYTGGNFSMLKINRDGSLQPPVQTIQHTGGGPVKSRQASPHVHMTEFHPAQKMLVVNDLGTDRVTAYHFQPGKKNPLDTAPAIVLKLTPGSGPRHSAVHPVKPLIYVLEELSGNVSVHHFATNNVSHLQTIPSDTTSSLPDKGSADIHLSADAKFLYTSNRGAANYLAIYSIDPGSGKLTRIGTQLLPGVQPRNFTIDASGKYLLVAQQKTGNISIFYRDTQTGLLNFTGNEIKIPSPVCLKMILKK